jgi:Cu+-exporting ATPase
MSQDQHTGSASAKVLDPVCGMSIDPTTAAGSVEFGGKHFYFCSAGCQSKFEADPKRYDSAASK